MLSDALFEFLEDIERYQTSFPAYYDDLREEIEHCKSAMRSLMEKLHDPPIPEK
jgi:hypothetical protein